MTSPVATGCGTVATMRRPACAPSVCCSASPWARRVRVCRRCPRSAIALRAIARPREQPAHELDRLMAAAVNDAELGEGAPPSRIDDPLLLEVHDTLRDVVADARRPRPLPSDLKQRLRSIPTSQTRRSTKDLPWWLADSRWTTAACTVLTAGLMLMAGDVSARLPGAANVVQPHPGEGQGVEREHPWASDRAGRALGSRSSRNGEHRRGRSRPDSTESPQHGLGRVYLEPRKAALDGNHGSDRSFCGPNPEPGPGRRSIVGSLASHSPETTPPEPGAAPRAAFASPGGLERFTAGIG